MASVILLNNCSQLLYLLMLINQSLKDRIMIKLLIALLAVSTTSQTVPFCRRNAGSLTDIHIIGFFPCAASNDTRGIRADNCDGIDRIPIMKLALEEINERCDLLPGYRLVVDYANSAVST